MSQDGIAVATLLALLLALLPTAVTAVEAADQRQWITAAGWGFFVIILLGLGTAVVLRRRPIPPLETHIFQPLATVQQLQAWPRPEEVGQLCDTLFSQPRGVAFVIGPSGAGKTVLLRKLLPDALPDHRFYYIDTYADLEEELMGIQENLRSKNLDEVAIIVLDQFEQYVAIRLQEATPSARHEREVSFTSILTDITTSQRAHFVISVRKEWYYDLVWLGETVPSPSRCVNVLPPRATLTETRRVIVQRFRTVLSDEDLAEHVVERMGADGQLRPLEVQLVGAVLERDTDASVDGVVDDVQVNHTLDDISTTIGRYFDGILDGAPDRRIAMKVLCALSAQTRFRRQRQRADILDVMFEDSDRVLDAINYLVAERLLVHPERAGYELPHDYLAELFHQQSGSELDPTDRDNIFFHIDVRRGRTSGVIATRAARERARHWSFAAFVGVPLIALMVIRLLQFGIPWVLVSQGPQEDPLLGNAIFDRMYFPIFIAHLGWAIYVCLFYHRVVRHIESGRVRAVGRLMVINMACCVLAAMFVPYVWVVSIAWGGFVVGTTLLVISRVRGLSPLARKRTALTAWLTMVNCFMLGLVGAVGVGVSVEWVDSPRATDYWIIGSLFVAVALSYACYSMMTLHTLRRRWPRCWGFSRARRAPSSRGVTIEQ